MPLRWSSLFAGLAVGAVLATAGRAEPPRIPDFHAVARLAGIEHPIEIRQSGGRRRVDIATGGLVQSWISDRTKGVLIALTAAGPRRLALVFPLGPETAETPLPLDLRQFSAQTLTRIGASQEAGRPCALFRYVAAQGRGGVICATADGIVLQLTPDGRPTPLFEVESLDYAPQNPRWFLPPPEYQVGVLPGLGGAAKPSP